MKLKNLNKSTLLIILAITLMASSCASKMQTETITYLSESDRADIKKLAIYVESDEQLNVNLSTINDRIWVAMLEDSGNCDSIGCIFLPLLVGAVAIVEESVRSGMDHAKEKEFRKDLSDINLNNLLSKSIAKSFENLNSEIHAEITDTYDQKVLVRNGFDSVLHININKIEANKCPRQVVHGYINPDQAAKGIGPISSDYDDSSEDISKWNEIYPEYNQMFQKDAANNLLSAPNTIKISNEEKEKRKKVDKEISPIKP
ncbi:MAG: hypothetical protein GWN56_18275, partial [Nitrosopumilaceae archaeon]|nr:hypothetical protein [Nitrosopumilaceae archaeon]